MRLVATLFWRGALVIGVALIAAGCGSSVKYEGHSRLATATLVFANGSGTLDGQLTAAGMATARKSAGPVEVFCAGSNKGTRDRNWEIRNAASFHAVVPHREWGWIFYGMTPQGSDNFICGMAPVSDGGSAAALPPNTLFAVKLLRQ